MLLEASLKMLFSKSDADAVSCTDWLDEGGWLCEGVEEAARVCCVDSRPSLLTLIEKRWARRQITKTPMPHRKKGFFSFLIFAVWFVFVFVLFSVSDAVHSHVGTDSRDYRGGAQLTPTSLACKIPLSEFGGVRVNFFLIFNIKRKGILFSLDSLVWSFVHWHKSLIHFNSELLDNLNFGLLSKQPLQVPLWTMHRSSVWPVTSLTAGAVGGILGAVLLTCQFPDSKCFDFQFTLESSLIMFYPILFQEPYHNQVFKVFMRLGFVYIYIF